MSNHFRHNHYVPEWYQKGFILPNQKDNELFYLDSSPGFFVDGVPSFIRSAPSNGRVFGIALPTLTLHSLLWRRAFYGNRTAILRPNRQQREKSCYRIQFF